MSRRTLQWNGFETKLAATLSPNTFSFTVESAIPLPSGEYYFVIDHDHLDNVEWIKVIAIAGNTMTIENPGGRGLEGSVGALGVGTEHLTGAILRLVFTKQLQDDLFSDIEDLEDSTTGLPGGLPGTYLAIDGSNDMAAPLTLQLAVPTIATEAVNKQYADDQDAATEAAAIAHADSLDHDHATPIETHRLVEGAHHAKYLDSDALAAIAAANVYIPLDGSETAAVVKVSGQVYTVGIRAITNDLTFANAANVELLRWDDSANEWEFKKTVDMENHTLKSPLDPTNGAHVGDRNYNDVRYPLLAAGAMGTTTPYGCDVYSSAIQSVPANGWDLLRMNVERYDPHGDFSLASGVERYTVPKTGLYVFGASARMNADDVSELRIQVEHSSGAAYEQETYPEGAHDPFISVFGIRYCTPGQTLRARLYQVSPGARNTHANSVRFWAGRLS